MKNTVVFMLIFLFIFPSLVIAQESRTVSINGTVFGSNCSRSIEIYEITVTPDHFILKTGYHEYDATLGNFISIRKIEEVVSGSYSYSLTIPRQYKKVFFWGLRGFFGCDGSLDLTPYENYVKARTNRKGLDDDEKPRIVLEYPTLQNNFCRTEELYITIEGHVKDNLGVLHLKINDEAASLNNDIFKKRLKLRIGKNNVLVKATDVNNNISTKDFVIIRDEIVEEAQFSDVDFPTPTSNRNDNAVAVVFGIENYRNAPPVPFAVNDADIFREYLIKRFGLRRENIYLRLDEQATKAEFDKVFSQNGWISRHSSIKTEVTVYFAGHGAPDIQTKETFLVPFDGDPDYATSTGYPLKRIYENLGGLGLKYVTVVMDACFSGGTRDNKSLLAGARPVRINIESPNVPKNMTIFTAATGSEISSAYDQKNHGIFTYFFLKGLNGNADENNDKIITVSEMQDYLTANVPVQAMIMGREQNPQMLCTDQSRVLLRY